MPIRSARFADMPLLAHIMVQSFRTAFASFVSPETMARCTVEENCRNMLEDLYRQGQMEFLTDGSGGMLIWQQGTDGAEILALHTLPECRGTGLGHALLTHALNQIGCQPVFLWAFRDNARARRFYEKHGFRLSGHQRVSEFDGAVEVRFERPLKPVRITALRCAAYPDLMAQYENPISHACDVKEGMVWISENGKPPASFCPSAWESMESFVRTLAAGGGNFFDGWMKNPHSACISCNDGFRPVSFYLETIEEKMPND